MKATTRRMLVGLMSMGLVAAFAGTISGSIAWYAYSTRVAITYSGTSVAESIQLQIGLVSDQDFTVDGEGHDLGFNLTYEEVEGETYDYYWAKAGTGFSAEAIQAFLKTEGQYAIKELRPITTREYDGSSFNLYRAPVRGTAHMTQVAPENYYSHVPFVFRIIDAQGNYAKNADIWLTGVNVAAAGANQNIREAVRLYFSEGSNDFVLNPSSLLTTVGYTKVAGLLDLNVDGTYDEIDGEEIVYGDYTNEPVITGTATADNHLDDPTIFDDVNQTGQTAKSTFVAEHLKGVKYYDRTAITNCVPKTAKFETLETIKPVDSDGDLSGGTPLTRTGAVDGLARLDVTIYLEGWDHSVIDTEIGHSFNLGLRFQVNRV